MEGKRRRIASFDDTGGPRAPLRLNFDDPEAFSEAECSQQDVVQHMVTVSGRPIIMYGTLDCSGSFSLSAVEYGYEAGKKPATCQICGRIFPCPITSRRSSVVSWSDSPRDQAVPKNEDAVMEDCTESHQAEINKEIKANDKVKCSRWVNSLGIKWERQRQPRAPVRPASRCCTLLVSLSQVSTPLPRVVPHVSQGLNLLVAQVST